MLVLSSTRRIFNVLPLASELKNLYELFQIGNSSIMKILTIDDNKSITGLFSKMLKLEGHECIVVNDGKSGVALLETEKFDGVTLDLAMPEFSGFDVIDALEKNGKLKENKMIVLTASSAGDVDEQKLINRGVHAILKKPVELETLLKALEDASAN